MTALWSEEWRDIPGYAGQYQVSDQGRVRSLLWRTPRLLRPWFMNKGYKCVTLGRKGNQNKCLVHRLVASAFIPNPDPLYRDQVNHKNGNRTDNRVVNLEWCSNQENAIHSVNVLGHDTQHIKKPVLCVETGERFLSVSEAARRVEGNNQNIVKCCQGKRHTHKGYHWAYAEEVETCER